MSNLSMLNKIENFSRLSDQECALLIQNNLLNLLSEKDGYFEWEVVEKFLRIEFEMRDPLCKLFNSAIKKNAQRIGTFTVTQWIEHYTRKYNGIERTPETYSEYTASDVECKKLKKSDLILLMKVLRLYDYLLVEPIFDLEVPVALMLKYSLDEALSIDNISKEIQADSINQQSARRRNLSQLNLADSLINFPKIGEQLVTSSLLKLKNFDHPVRPSVKNWIYDYTSFLGQGPHEAMQRMKYLFHTENTEKLSSQEREKLSILLKSFDENIPLAINTETQEVVFENLAQPAVRNLPPRQASTTPERKIEESSFVRRYNPAGAIPRPISQSAAMPDKVRSIPPLTSRGIPQGQTLSDSSKPNFKAPLPKIDHSFRPEVAKFKQSAPNLEKRPAYSVPKASKPPRSVRDFSQPSSPSDNLQFFNPYPTPEKHEMKLDQIAVPQSEIQRKTQLSGQAGAGSPIAKKQNDNAALQSTIKVKGFTEKQTAQPKRKAPATPSRKPADIPPNRQKNVLYPHDYFAEKEEKPEVRIEGNIVDLSGQ